jgi:hypothetical protein
MSSTSAPTAKDQEPRSPDDEEAREDYMDYYAAVEAVEDALKNPEGIKTMEDFAKELDL